MVYIERLPHPALANSVKSFWYVRDPQAASSLERVLPAGHMQMVFSLANDYLTDCGEFLTRPSGMASARRSAAALVTGMRWRYDLIDTLDMKELMGVVFRPGRTTLFLPENTAAFAGSDTPLEGVWGQSAETLRTRLQEAENIEDKFSVLEAAFLRRLYEGKGTEPPAAVLLALDRISMADSAVSIHEVVRATGLSDRRLSQIFCEQVGVTPKVYQRIVRFQRAVQQIHRGSEVRWAQLALECGYYDQSHFVNEFREFSGICPSAYSRTTRVWSNHVPVDPSSKEASRVMRTSSESDRKPSF